MPKLKSFLTGIIAIFVVGSFVLPFSRSTLIQAAPPVQWEYKIINLTDDLFDREMNRHGEAGWELAFARRGRGGGMAGRAFYEVIFKRPKKF